MKRFLFALLSVAISACAGLDRDRDGVGEARIGGFAYEKPGVGWTATRYPPSQAGLVHHHYKRDGDRLQFQLSQIAPVRRVTDQAAVIAWAAQAGGGRAEAADVSGAVCARYAHRWRQTLSLGGPPQPWATIEERGLFCIDPQAPDQLMQARVLERLPPEAPVSPEFDFLADRLLARVIARPADPVSGGR